MKIKGTEITIDDINRLYSKITTIEKGENTGCWRIDFAEVCGYPVTSIKDKQIRCSRFMYQIWHPEEDIDGKVIMHSCDNRWCVCPDHLSSGTIQDNTDDKCNKNRQAKGETCGSSVLSEEEVIKILDGILDNTYKSITHISDVFLIGTTTTCNILHGNTWSHITKNYDLDKINNIIKNNNHYKQKLTHDDVRNIRKRLKNNETCVSISKIYNVHEYTISQIKNNKRHKNVI